MYSHSSRRDGERFLCVGASAGVGLWFKSLGLQSWLVGKASDRISRVCVIILDPFEPGFVCAQKSGSTHD